MNKITKITLLPIAAAAIVGLAVVAQAANSSLNISPNTVTLNPGDAINATISLQSSGDKICTVKGTLVFNNVTCQNITTLSETMPQKNPTCADSSFVIGIAKCTTSNLDLFTVSAQAGAAGTGSISFSDVGLVGEGVIVSTDSNTANYTINQPIVPEVVPEVTVTLGGSTNNTNTGNESQTGGEVTEGENTSGEVTGTTETTGEENQNQTAALTGASGFGQLMNWIGQNLWWLILLLLVLALIAYYYYTQKENQKKVS